MQTFKISQMVGAEEYEFPRLIGLTGPKGVGKTTFANKIGGQIFSLAEPIKDMLKVIINPKYVYNDKEAQIPGFPEGITGRKLLQSLGTEWGRNHFPQIWINPTREKLLDLISASKATGTYARAIVDDIRFNNEAEMIKELDGEVWLLQRDGFKPLSDTHSSEAGVSEQLIDKCLVI